MKIVSRYLTLLLLFFCIAGFTQNVLILEKANKRKLIKFKVGDRIKVYAEPNSITISGRIAQLTDTSIIFEKRGYEVPLSHVRMAYTPRWGMGFLSELFLKAGIGYAVVAGANQAISGNQPENLKNPIIIGGSLVVASFLIKPLATRKHNIFENKWRIQILDFTPSSVKPVN